MDIIAHVLWTTAAATAVRRKVDRPVHLGLAAFWGVFPDLASFTIPATLRIWWRLTGASKSLLPEANGPHFEWVWTLYNCVHSGLVFALFFGAAWLFARRPVLEMFGWLLHILIDIFTHRGLFATHFLWPVSSVHVDGIPWETGWFMAVNYAALALVFLLLWATRAAVTRTKRRVAAAG
ncbi:MAG TPA: hypothetical protein VKU19_10470 [Bryobacteraceae bacterium]|nr:hypothetical protein [Bryobacteraceae bacterium]